MAFFDSNASPDGVRAEAGHDSEDAESDTLELPEQSDASSDELRSSRRIATLQRLRLRLRTHGCAFFRTSCLRPGLEAFVQIGMLCSRMGGCASSLASRRCS